MKNSKRIARRSFVTKCSKLTLLPIASFLNRCGIAPQNHSNNLQDKSSPALIDMPMFGFYQGFGPNQTLLDRDLSRTDGTGTGTLLATQVDDGVAIELDFWHGHRELHSFTVLPQHFDKLREGETVYILTTVVADHKHCVEIIPQFEPDDTVTRLTQNLIDQGTR